MYESLMRAAIAACSRGRWLACCLLSVSACSDGDVGGDMLSADAGIEDAAEGESATTRDSTTNNGDDSTATDSDSAVSDSAVSDTADGGTPGGGVGPTITVFTASGPITVTSGMTIQGLHITSTTGPCIRGSGVSNVRITNNKIGPCAPDASGIGVSFDGGSHDVRIDHNLFDDVASAYYTVGNGNNNVFDHNLAKRVRGPGARGQMVQFNAVNGTGNQVTCNVSDQTSPGYLAGPEDHISPFASSGTAASPLLFAYNKIRGGGPSMSGGGILAGDYDGSYIEIRGNILISPGQYGLAIAGGRNSKIIDNLVYSPTPHAWSNNGLFIWAQIGSGPCYGHEISGNRVYFINRDGISNAGWNAGNCGTVAGWSTNVFTDKTLTAAIWDTVIPQCL